MGFDSHSEPMEGVQNENTAEHARFLRKYLGKLANFRPVEGPIAKLGSERRSPSYGEHI